jgi:putative transposase
MSLHKLLNSLKESVYPWMYEVSKCAMQEALRDLDRSYQNWWRRLREGKSGKSAGPPKFKSRQRDGIGSFRLTGSIRVEHVPLPGRKPRGRRRKDVRAYMYLPRCGRIRLAEAGRFPEGALTEVTVSEYAGHWYVSSHVPAHVPARVRTDLGQRCRNVEAMGVDPWIDDLGYALGWNQNPLAEGPAASAEETPEART